MNVPTKTDVQDLLNQFKGDGLMLSCYVDLTVTDGFQSHGVDRFNARAHEIKANLADNPVGWDACARNLEAIRKALVAPESPEARGMAVFSALQRGFFRAIPLSEPVKDELIVHRSPYLVPLLEARCRYRSYLVVHTDTHHGRLYSATPSGVELLESIDQPVPRKQNSAGECWGMQQATIARHRDECIHHYLKELVGRIETIWGTEPFAGIVLLGEHEVLEHVRKLLPRLLAARVMHEAPQAWSDWPNSIDRDVRAILAEARRVEEQGILKTVQDRLAEGYAIAAGPAEVLTALQTGKIGPKGYGCLVLSPDPRESVARCSVCRTLYAEMPARCPKCQSACDDASLWEEVLLLALRHDITTYSLPADQLLTEAGGLFAVLPRNGPALNKLSTPS